MQYKYNKLPIVNQKSQQWFIICMVVSKHIFSVSHRPQLLSGFPFAITPSLGEFFVEGELRSEESDFSNGLIRTSNDRKATVA